MKPVKTHTFKMGTYEVLQQQVDGWCDDPREKGLQMCIPDGSELYDLWTTLHEAMHAEDVPKKMLDGDRDASKHIARFLWRLGWRKETTKETG
jgi:hypothetical protein